VIVTSNWSAPRSAEAGETDVTAGATAVCDRDATPATAGDTDPSVPVIVDVPGAVVEVILAW
jgi:hypothetical protein